MLGSSRRVTFLWVVACCVAVATAQTFQYSRGWTNGRKRAAAAVLSHQQLHVRRAAEVAVKRAAAILEDAGLLLVPAACDSQPLTFHLLRRPPTMQVIAITFCVSKPKHKIKQRNAKKKRVNACLKSNFCFFGPQKYFK